MDAWSPPPVYPEMDEHEMDALMLSPMPPPPTPQPRPHLLVAGPQKRQFNHRFPPQEWEAQKSIIQTLYKGENKPLNYVRDVLRAAGFDPTLRQLKRKVHDWGLDTKNIKTDSMLAIARTRVKRKRLNKDSTFRLHGVLVDEPKIERFMKRRHLTENALISEPSPINAPSPAFSVWTPRSDPPDTVSETPRETGSGLMPPPPVRLPMLDSRSTRTEDQSVEAPSPAPSFSWIHNPSTPFTGQSPASFFQEPFNTDASMTSEAITDVDFDWECIDVLESNMAPFPDDIPPPVHEKRCFQDEEDEYRAKYTRDESILGPEHPETLDALASLAGVLEDQGRYRAAEIYFRQLAHIRLKVMSQDNPATVSALLDLGRLFVEQGRNRSAERLYRQLLKNKLNTSTTQFYEINTALATALYNQDRHEEASTIQKEILSAYQDQLGPEHRDTLYVMSNLALSLNQQGFLSQASGMQRHILGTREKILGEDHVDTIEAKVDLARSLKEEGAYAESEKLLKEALEVERRTRGIEHPHTLRVECDLGCVFARQERFQEAEIISRRVWNNREKILGKDHPDTLVTGFELGDCLERQNRHEEAEIVFRAVADLEKRVIGEDDPRTLISLYRVANSMVKQKKYVEAEDLHRQVLIIRKTALGDMHLHTVESELDLAWTIKAQGRHVEAEKLAREILKKSVKAFGADHRMSLRSMSYLAQTLEDQDRLQECRHLYQEIFERSEKVLGAMDRDTLTRSKGLKRVEKKLAEAESLLTMIYMMLIR